MAATYLSVIAVCVASLAIGQAAMTICGARSWSWLSPAVGLALVTALCWATVRLPGDGVISAIAVALLSLAALVFLRGRVEGVGEVLRIGAPLALAALLAASLPFIVEGRFGILGTSFNPDMSQHLLAADRLAHGADSQLLSQGYPLGPHAIVVALDKGLGVGLVQGFGGLTLAVSVLASLTALGALGQLRPFPRWLAALLVGLPYMAASYLAQGAFKETMQALFVLAFAIGLLGISARAADPGTGGSVMGGRGGGPEGISRASSVGRSGGVSGRAIGWLAAGHTPRPAPAVGSTGPLVAVPLGLLAAGSVYTYSFPGLTWLLGALGIWALAELLLIARSGGDPLATLRGAVRPAGLASVVLIVLAAPELGRMVDFASFETFDPNGPGLGNLFGQVSPAETLGIWPSGDFRLSPGDGAVPAIAFYAGVAFAALLLAWALTWWLRRRETALPAALAAAVLAYLAARIGGTPYTAAKAIEMAAPLAMLTIVRPLLDLDLAELRRPSPSLLKPFAAAAFAIAAGAGSLLALANGPVGPTSYSSGLATLRPQLANQSVLIVASQELLDDQHGAPYLAWELRGTRLCIVGEGADSRLPSGVRYVIAQREPPARGALELQRRAGPYALYRRKAAPRGPSVCPLIAVRTARQGEKQG